MLGPTSPQKPTPKWVSKPIQIKEHFSNLSKEVIKFKHVCGIIPFESSRVTGPMEPRPSTSQFDSAEVTGLGLGLGQSQLSRPRPIQPLDKSRQKPRPRPKPRPRATRPGPTEHLSVVMKAFNDLGSRQMPTTRTSLSKETLEHLGLDSYLDLGIGRNESDVKVNIQDLLAIDLDEEHGLNKEVDQWKLFPENSNYETIKMRREALPQGDDPSTFKYPHFVLKRHPVFDPDEVADLTPNVTVLVFVRVYWPFHLANTKRLQKDPKFSQEIVILGSQTLDRLREMIACIIDGVVPSEVSDNPRNIPHHTTKELYKSAFFFINGTFYNDLRHPDNVDYSEGIRKWATEKNIAQFETAVMESTKVEDLTVQLGHPYLYMHQGCCEHLITISDIRLLQEGECRSSALYPYVVSTSEDKIGICFICSRLPARWLVEDNLRLPCTPCYFCEKCFHSFNYVNGKKVGQFKAYYFQQPICIP